MHTGPQATAIWPEPSRSVSLSRVELLRFLLAGVLPVLVVGEEFGLLACALVVLLYLAFTVRILVRLVDEEDLFTILAATGLTAQIGGQAFINVLVNLQLFPSKGMTLPLISYGGSSTVALCLTVGFLLAITRRNPFLTREKFGWRHALSNGDAA